MISFGLISEWCSGSVISHILFIKSWWSICFVLDCVKPFTTRNDPQFEFWGQNSFLAKISKLEGLKREKDLDKDPLFFPSFFFLTRAPTLLFPPLHRTKTQPPPTAFPLRNRENFQICSALSSPPAALGVGANFSDFWVLDPWGTLVCGLSLRFYASEHQA
ncbi:hypothetical protein SLEP1_g53431 [Rubroshorea leprosula]|uniref:Cytochrome c biogenesis B n=1 Tax=Rubroshorea leprosula TaxID=152421 RepID=A0AAV5M9C2_9ROSI|nr:hypothetical protein SLEP1_g53431 [Rubroshorea leprosula]